MKLTHYNLPMYTRDTTGTGSSMPRCAKVHYRTCTCDTHFGNTVGFPVPVPNPNKRSWSLSPDANSETGGAKKRINVSSLLWVIREQVDSPSSSVSLQQTQSTLKNFSHDPKLAKASLLNSVRLPQFPDSKWTSLVTGHSVDLDHVLAALYAVVQDK
jgi:hypothetical protein